MIAIIIDDKEYSLEEAKKLYLELKELFEKENKMIYRDPTSRGFPQMDLTKIIGE